MEAIENIKDEKIKNNIVDDIIKNKGLYCLVSNAKVGKSMLALQLSYAITKGEKFLGHNTMSSPVLYISTESDSGQIKERLKTLEIEYPKESFFIIDRNGNGEINIFDFEVDIADFADNKGGKILIIDMLKDINFGIDYDINNYQDIGQKLLPKLRQLCNKYNIAILFTHHLNKQGKTLGSTAFDAVVDGKLTLTENKNDKSLIKLNVINRDFKELELWLKKQPNQIFNVIDPVEDDDININLINFIKYVVNKKDFEFTCTDIVNNANLLLTPRQFGRLINSNLELLKKEGINISKYRTGSERKYIAHYEEPSDENE